VVFQRSQIRIKDVVNGTSNTFMVGEKYLNPKNYLTGFDPADNETMYVGMDNDTCRNTFSPPLRDRPGYQDTMRFGSMHPAGVQMCRCDGSVNFEAYSIDPKVWRRMGNRN
jgi:hypothetical protein